MKNRCIWVYILTIILTFNISDIFSQKSSIYTYAGYDFYKGLELYEKQKFGSARNFFEKVVEEETGSKSELKTEAQYYLAMSAIHLFHLDAEYLVFKFAKENPESPLINNAYYRLADYMYKKRTYAKAISYYNLVDRHFLDKEELAEYYFQKGFSYYSRNNYPDARVCFYEIKDYENKYTSPALYYYSHIAYEEQNYQTALNGFLRLLNDETFSPIAPYYVAQIYYLQKKFDKVVEFAPPLMESVTEKRSAEMAKIIGDSYFYLEQYEPAIQYLQQYRDEAGRIPVQDKYQLAYAFYMTGEFEEAAKIFERISMTNSEISQSSLYHLADCFLKMGDKKRARSAFSSAARLDFNQKIKEDALFNYAKVTYELSYSPFNEAVRAFNTYISQYPASPRVDEAYNFLVMAYMSTRNYRMALESLEKIKEMSTGIERAYQKVAFYRGLEIFSNQRYNDAISVFDKSLKFDQYDSRIKARTLYWLGESYQMTGDSETAADFYRLFLNEPASYQTPEHKMVTYSLGYMEFKDRDYNEAERWFREYVNLETDKNSTTIADAYNRLGDCRYMNSSYWQAIEYYDKVIELSKADVDYAYFQKGFSLGLVDRPQRKIETLSELASKFPESAYIDDSYFEMGKSYVLLGNTTSARDNYLKIVNDFEGSPYMSRALVQLGLIDKNAGRNIEALEFYKKVVRDYPGSTEASNALKSIKDIYVNMDNVDGYLAYVEEIGQGVSRTEQDSLLYISAENSYLAGNCEKAIPNLKEYLERFPNGSFLLNANYYLADCLLKLNRGDEAYESLLYIIDQPVSMFTEPALVAASRIAYRKKDFNQAAAIYSRIITIGEKKSNIKEAEIGLMRCYVQLDEYQNTINAANQVLLQDKLDEQIEKEAQYYIADAYFQQRDVNAAFDWYQQIANEVNSTYGAEAKYRTAQISFNRGEVDKAEEIIFEFIDLNTPHQYWMGKSFILLADVYLEKNDDFQAVQTLESVINYYTIKDDGIIEEAAYKKEQITSRVNSESGEEESADMDIELVE